MKWSQSIWFLDHIGLRMHNGFVFVFIVLFVGPSRNVSNDCFLESSSFCYFHKNLMKLYIKIKIVMRHQKVNCEIYQRTVEDTSWKIESSRLSKISMKWICPDLNWCIYRSVEEQLFLRYHILNKSEGTIKSLSRTGIRGNYNKLHFLW